MARLTIEHLVRALERAPDGEKLTVLKTVIELHNFMSEPKPGTEPTIENGVDIARLDSAIATMELGEIKNVAATLTEAYGANPKSPKDKAKIMAQVKAGKVARLQYSKPVRSTVVLLPPS